MQAGLELIKKEGWIPLASAMVGAARTSAWAVDTWALCPISGTSIEFRLKPTGLTIQKELLFLGQWHRTKELIAHSVRCTWLRNVDKELGSDCTDSPDEPFPPLTKKSQNAVVLCSQPSWHVDASLLQNLGLEVANLEPREKEVTVDFALMQIALTNQMETLREVVAVVLSGAMPAEQRSYVGCWILRMNCRRQ